MKTMGDAFDAVRKAIGRYPQSDEDSLDDTAALGALAMLEAELERLHQQGEAHHGVALDMERQRDEVRAAWDALMVRAGDVRSITYICVNGRHDGHGEVASRISRFIIGDGLRPAPAVEGVSTSLSNVEPSTAEAFETLRAEVLCEDVHANVRYALALLKRRMGALEQMRIRSAAELRHAYHNGVRDWALVARVIAMLERSYTPSA